MKSYNNIFRTFSLVKTGLSHEKKGKQCEDRAFAVADDGFSPAVAVLCDGAGSCENSGLGAEIVSSAVLKLLTQQFDDLYRMKESDFADCILETVNDELYRTVKEKNCTYRSLSATLLCTAVHPDGRYFYFHIGDGIIVSSDNSEIKIISQYRHEKACNISDFVTSTSPRYNYGKGTNGISGFMLMSDGLEEMLSDGDEITFRGKLFMQIAYFLSEKRMYKEAESLFQLAQKRGFADDISFAVIADKRNAEKVFNLMNPEIRSRLFYIPENLSKKQIKQYSSLLRELIKKNGMNIYQISGLLHTHGKTRTLNKIEGLIESEIISFNGKKYIL